MWRNPLAILLRVANSARLCTIAGVIAEKPKGRCEVVHGSMFGGKTEYLISRLRQEQSRGLTVIAFKHMIDDRYDPDHLVTHREDHFDATRVPEAASILKECGDADVVGIDEGHFFKLELVSVFEELVERGVSVIVAGISHDAWGRPFEPMPQLLALAEYITKTLAICVRCGAPANRSQRLIASEERVVVGAGDVYEARCRDCFDPELHSQ